MPSRAVLPEAAAAADPRFREFFAYWERKAPPGRLPGRQHIDPGEMPRLLPGIVLYDVVRDGRNLRFRWRLVGTSVVAAVGADHTGQFVDEVILDPAQRAALQRALAEVVRTRAPRFWRTPISYPGREFVALERLALPLASDGETVDVVIAYYVVVTPPRSPGAKPAP
jgi:hypothetical protein